MPSKTIIHDAANHRFVIELPNNQQALVLYRLNAAQSSVDFTSTFVPPSERGKGLAEQLVKTAFEWADTAGLSISASCWYADRVLKERSQGSQS